MDNTPSPSQRRLQRTRSAQLLVALNASCSRDELQSIDWEALTSVPHWCFMDADTRRYLQLVCGALFAGPSIQNWIDGARIKRACELLGERAYSRVLSKVDACSVQVNHDEPDVERLFLTGGASVLTGAVDHPGVRKLVSSLFESSLEPLSPTIATPLYTLGLSVFDDELAALNAASASA